MYNVKKPAMVGLMLTALATMAGCSSSGGGSTGGDEETGVETPTDFLFVGKDAVNGTEIWHSDGTREGTGLLKDLNTLGHAAPANFTQVGDTVFFTADDGVHGVELWKRDASGTTMVADINPEGSSSFRHLTAFNGELYFMLASGHTDTGLWRSDGTAAGTEPFDMTVPGNRYYQMEVSTSYLYYATSGSIYRTDGTQEGTELMPSLLASGERYSSVYDTELLNGTLYFTALSYDASGYLGSRLWRLDNAATEPAAVDMSLQTNRYQLSLAALNNELIFIAYESTAGAALWRTDGTSAGTTALRDAADQPVPVAFGYPLTVTNDHMYFLNASNRLQVTDGTPAGTVQLSDASNPGIIGTMNGGIYFKRQYDDPVTLWYSDGTVAGTVQIGEQNAYRGQAVGGAFYFSSYDEDDVQSLWKSAGTAATTVKLADFESPVGEAVALSNMFATSDTLLFSGFAPQTGYELWQSDGTAAGTSMVLEINPTNNASSHPEEYAELGNRVYFSAYSEAHGYALYASDGTTNGTQMLKGGFGNIYEITASGGSIYFGAYTEAEGTELWVSDGTTEGTRIAVDFYPGDESSYPGNLVSSSSDLYFEVEDFIWKTDGTEQGTRIVSFRDGYTMKPVGDRLFFVPRDRTYGAELWVTDGTLSSTRMVKDIHPTGSSIDRYDSAIYVMNDTVYFRASDGANGYELWKSDGTEEGTTMVVDLAGSSSGLVSNEANRIAINGNELYFIGNDMNGNDQLYKTDGTEAGTIALTDDTSTIRPYSIQNMYAFNGRVYFSCDDETLGVELCATDGSREGTGLFKDIALDGSDSYPWGFRAVNDRLFFFAEDNESAGGEQVWVTDGTEEGTIKLRDATDARDDSWALGTDTFNYEAR